MVNDPPPHTVYHRWWLTVPWRTTPCNAALQALDAFITL